MDIKKDPESAYAEDNVSSAEGQLDVASATYRRMPESVRNLSDDEVKSLNKKLVRKVDLFVLPTIGILYILNYIDRQNLAAAKLQGIMEDLNMSTEQFATRSPSSSLDTCPSKFQATFSSQRSHGLACTSAGP